MAVVVGDLRSSWGSGGFQPEEITPASSQVVSGYWWGLICSFIYIRIYIKDQDGLTYQKIIL